MANLPDRPNPIGGSPTLTQALNRIASWEQYADDVEGRWTRLEQRIADLQDRIEARRENMQQLSDQIADMNGTITARDTTITALLARRSELELQVFNLTQQNRALEAELELLRNP